MEAVQGLMSLRTEIEKTWITSPISSQEINLFKPFMSSDNPLPPARYRFLVRFEAGVSSY